MNNEQPSYKRKKTQINICDGPEALREEACKTQACVREEASFHPTSPNYLGTLILHHHYRQFHSQLNHSFQNPSQYNWRSQTF